MTKLRIKSAGDIPRFAHEGIDINQSWTEIDVSKLAPNTRDALELYTGSHVAVYPDDRDAYASALGLEWGDDGRLQAPKDEKLGERHTAKAAATKAAPKPTGSTAATSHDSDHDDTTKRRKG